MSKQRNALDEALSELYGAPLADFVAERKRLAAGLREAGFAAEADEIAARRKPSVPVHVANRLARERADEVAAIVEAARAMAKAYEAGDAETLRARQSSMAEQIRSLVASAEAVGDGPLSDAVEQRLAVTLRSAALDPESAPLLERGVLTEEVEPTGFSALAALKPARGKRKAAVSATSERASRDRKQRDEVRRLEAELADARHGLADAEKALDRAERAARRARDAEHRAQQKLDRARAT